MPSLERFPAYPNGRSRAKDIYDYTRIDIKNISSEEWDWNELNMIAYPRLTCNPSRPAYQIIAEYFERACGSAFGPMLRQWLALEEAKHS